jgi:membrane fusion protein (multidrug efflux system)
MSKPALLAAHGALALSLFAFSGCTKEEARPSRPTLAPYEVEIVTVTPRPFREALFATGSLRARESVTLQAERAGVVEAVRFEEGQSVKAGDVLVLIDDSELQAQLDSAKARLELATATEKRDRALVETKLVSAAAYDQSLAGLHTAEADVKLIEAQLSKTRIVAPFDGIAGLRRVSVGAYVTPGTAIASFQDVGVLKLDFTLPERYLADLRRAKSVNIRIAGVSEPVTGEIYAVEPAIDAATRSLQVRANVPNKGRLLLPGAFAEVEVTLGEIPDAILIPPIALIPGLKDQKVFVHQSGRAEERVVEPGLRTTEGVHIVRGLEAGDEVIVSGILQLRPGANVRVRAVREAGAGSP